MNISYLSHKERENIKVQERIVRAEGSEARVNILENIPSLLAKMLVHLIRKFKCLKSQMTGCHVYRHRFS